MQLIQHLLLTLFLLFVSYSLTAQAEKLPRPDHVVVVIEENSSFKQITDARHQDSYIHALVKRGMLFTRSHGITHPSQPNYLALFSGSTHGITRNTCPLTLDSDNLASVLIDAGLSFTSYAESLPAIGDTICASGAYQRKHNPLVNWQGSRLPAELNKPLSNFPTDYSQLPTIAFVIPNQKNDMHDGSFEDADRWLKNNISSYVDWATKNNSLLILTWDEDDFQKENHIATILVGAMVNIGESDQNINHYNVLRTLLAFYGLPALGESVDSIPFKNIWQHP